MRDRMAGWDVRTAGTNAGPHLRLYVSEELHYCHQQAAELLGMGREALRLVPTDEAYRMRLNALQEMIAADRATGDKPIGVIASAGTIGTGAVARWWRVGFVSLPMGATSSKGEASRAFSTP